MSETGVRVLRLCWVVKQVKLLHLNHKLYLSHVLSSICKQTNLTFVNLLVPAGVLVDRTGQYYHVFFACSAVVASAAVFLMASFFWLDKRDRKSLMQGQPSAPPEPARPVDIVPGCQYSSVPTEGDKDKASANGAEYITSL